jgi:hypothetical protein
VILETAKAAYDPNVEDHKAAILGFGKGRDMPLAELAKMYHVTIVDLDTSGTIKAREQLPKDLQSKVTIIAADLTGVVSGWSPL